jgi:hypothetical protein
MSHAASSGEASTASEAVASYLRRLRESGPLSTLSLRALIAGQEDSDAPESVKLATLSDALNGKSFPTWDTTRRVVSLLQGDLEEARNVWRAQARRARSAIANLDDDLPPGLFRWRRWLEMAEITAIGSSAEASRDCNGPMSIERDIEQVALDWVADRLDGESIGGRLLVLWGRRGAGKSYGLFRSAHQIEARGWGDRLFVAHDPVSLGNMNLDTRALYGQDRPLILIDDADFSEALGPILRALQSSSVLIIITASNSQFVEHLRLVVAAHCATFYNLPAAVTADEVRQLQNQTSAIRVLNRRERNDLDHATIATAVRIIHSPTETSKEVSELRRLLESGTASSAADLLAISSSKGLPVPRGVVAQLLKSPQIPHELESWIVRESTSDGDQVVWFADSPSTANLQLYLQADMGRKAYHAHVEKTAETILSAIDDDNQTHRSFLRRFLRSIPRTCSKSLLSNNFEKILEVASKDSLSTFAYMWLPIITQKLSDEIPVSPKLRGVLGRTPTSGTDVALLIYFMGPDVAADRLSEILADADAWPAQPWVTFLRMIPRALGAHRRRVACATLTILTASNVDLDDIVKDNNALRTLTDIIEDFGTHSDRVWWWRFVLRRVNSISAASTKSNLRFASQLAGLTERCIGQERSRIALAALRFYLGSPYSHRSMSWDRLVEQYNELQLTEAQERIAGKSIDALLSLAELSLKIERKVAIWSDILRIARHRDHGRLLDLAGRALLEMQMWNARGVAANKYSELHLITVRCFSQCREMSPELADWLLRWFQVRTSSSWQAQLFVATVSAFASAKNPAAADAQQLLSMIPKQESKLVDDMDRFCRSAAQYAGIESCVWPSQIRSLSSPANEQVVGELLLNLQLIPQRQQVSPGLLRIKFGRSPRIRGILVTELLRIGAAKEAGKILPAARAATSQNSLVMRAAIDGTAGDLESAENRLREALNAYEGTLIGAHPVWARKSACAMTSCAPSTKRRILALIAQIMSREQLPDITIALERPHPVNFEPSFFPALPSSASELHGRT